MYFRVEKYQGMKDLELYLEFYLGIKGRCFARKNSEITWNGKEKLHSPLTFIETAIRQILNVH